MPASRAMRVQVLEHVPFEGVGSIEGWLRARGADVRYTRFHETGHALPDVRGLDLVIAMGGPMSVNDEATLPWRKAEKQSRRDAIGAGVAVLGVCLGAQLVASALGARVQPNAQKEIGWLDVRATPAPVRSATRIACRRFIGTADLRVAARRPAPRLGDACLNQAFQLGTNVVGVQFHLETTREPGRDDRRRSGELVEAAFVRSGGDPGPPASVPAHQRRDGRAADYLTRPELAAPARLPRALPESLRERVIEARKSAPAVHVDRGCAAARVAAPGARPAASRALAAARRRCRARRRVHEQRFRERSAASETGQHQHARVGGAAK